MGVDYNKLPEDFKKKLSEFQEKSIPNQQLQTLADLAVIAQELLNVADAIEKGGKNNAKQFGALLTDIREKITSLDALKAPEMPDFAKPVVESVNSLEKALTASIKALDVKPQVNVEAPNVNVEATKVDLTGVEKILKSELPKAFDKAVKAIPKTTIPKSDYTPLLEAISGLSEQLSSIETATRMKPQGPSTIGISNWDAMPSSTPAKASDEYGITAISEDSTYKYFWFEADDADYYIMRKHKTTKVFTFTAGTGGYSAVYVDENSGPSGSPTWGTRGNTF